MIKLRVYIMLDKVERGDLVIGFRGVRYLSEVWRWWGLR